MSSDDLDTILRELERQLQDEARSSTPLYTPLAHSSLFAYKDELATPLEYLTLPFHWLEVKSLAAKGSVSGYVAAFHNLDLTRDIILPGSFTKTIAEAKEFAKAHNTQALFPVLWQHDKDDPIGYFSQADEDSHGLLTNCA